MKKKIISILMIILLIGALIVNYWVAYAAVASDPLNAYLEETDQEGIGYAISNPKGEVSGQAPYIWDIRARGGSYTQQRVIESPRNLYCVKADYGQTWFTQEKEDESLEYNLYYDMQTDRKNLLDNLKDNTNTADDVIKSLLTPGEGQYEQLLWIFDHSYIRGNNVDEYLESVGISKTEEGKYYNKETMEVLGTETLTETDIIAIQRMVIWYFTNGSENEVYDKTGENENLWLNITTDGGNTYNALANVSQSRNKLAMYLYRYLINSAKNNATNIYTAENNYKTDNATVNVNTTNLTQENGKYVIETKRNGANYLIGPIVIENNNAIEYDIEIQVKDQDDKILTQGTDYIYTDANGTALENIVEPKDLVGITGGFYISVSRSKVESVDIDVYIANNTTKKILWLQGTETENGIILNAEQPLVEIGQEPQIITVELTSKPEEFDLALRKYITGLQDKNGTDKQISNKRNLNNISLDTLLTGTTATYKHRKDPVVVEDKDEITYTIKIYNEGNHDGYASKIIDQLPTGLVNSTNNGTTIISKDKDGNNKNTYKMSYNSTLNQIILEIDDTTSSDVKDIKAYDKNSLDYEVIEIKCMVAQEADTKEQIILTNVAYIAAAYDSEKGTEILTKGQDIDSEPQTIPNINKDNMQNYRGNTSNKEILTDSEYFYEGQQDDDDFEKLVIMPVEKVFDLALFKHIAAISEDQKIENGEYVTDTGNIDGTYLRAPIVKSIDAETGKITYEQDDKEALTVEPGDYVLYTIRVYNEGEINGYASKIKDTLPIGLEFVVENEEYNGIWNIEGVDTDGRQVVATTWYAKGQGAEAGTVEGDANYKANLLKALNKETAISDENPDYIDAQVLCRVVEDATSDRVLVNYAQISDDSDENGDPIDDVDSTPDEWIDGEDDQDIERIKVQCFDLSLRKFISSVNGIAPETSREPVVNVSNLVNKTGTTAVYEHTKTPLSVQIGDKVIYSIRVYNEGDINGFASEIKDYLPPYLTYVKDSEINSKYSWEISDDGRVVTTKYLSDTELKAFNGTKLDYADVKIECIVSDNTPLKETQTNIAEISEYTYNGSTVGRDIDSTSNNIESKIPEDDKLPEYKDEEISKNYVPGYEDDDDFEKIYIREFDLALRKFITQIQDNEVTTRIPQVKMENGVISYEHSKDPITVHVADRIVYTLRIYNEGEISGYASEISDDIPEYLEYLPEDSTNVEYMWKMYDENGEETDNVEKAVKIKTAYLSKENGEDNLIKAYDGETLSYKEIKIAFKVKDPNSNQYIITNYAQISDDTDEAGNQIKDKDSETDIWNDGEDDQDIENIKVEYFDLALVKFVSKVIVIENGKETVTETGYNGHEDPEPVVKVELHKKKLDQVVVKFGYGITVTNEGDIPGYATELTDYVPEGLKFVAEDNPNWTDEGNNVISTRQLENTLLQPGESATVEVIFTWINGADNLALKTNVVEISEDKNEYDVPDRDSTPDNKVEGEDDIDIAKVILTITTGATKTYLGLTIGLLAVIATGIVLIKKFVI